MQCNMLTIYYYADVCSCTCCVANKVTLSLYNIYMPRYNSHALCKSSSTAKSVTSCRYNNSCKSNVFSNVCNCIGIATYIILRMSLRVDNQQSYRQKNIKCCTYYSQCGDECLSLTWDLCNMLNSVLL